MSLISSYMSSESMPSSTHKQADVVKVVPTTMMVFRLPLVDIVAMHNLDSFHPVDMFCYAMLFISTGCLTSPVPPWDPVCVGDCTDYRIHVSANQLYSFSGQYESMLARRRRGKES